MKLPYKVKIHISLHLLNVGDHFETFSTTIPTPTVVAFACFTMSLRPSEASPLAKKSSMISTLSSAPKNSSDTMTTRFIFVMNEYPCYKSHLSKY